MIVGYFENGEISKAKEVFDYMDLVGVEKDTISWNSMASGYVDNGSCDKALEIFRDSQLEEGIEADSYTLGSALAACADLAALKQGKEIHSYAIRRGLSSNPFVCGSLVELYSKCRDVVRARMVFDQVIEHDTATWNALVSGYSRSNQMEKVHELLLKMELDGVEPNIYTWNGIIAGNAENRNNELALQNFYQLQISNLKPDIYTIGIVISVCSSLSTIKRGKQVHAHSIRCGYDTEVIHIGSSLVDMYSKCGNIGQAWLAFKRISRPNLVSWNSMLAAFAMHGPGKEGIALFCKMQEEGVGPDGVTFLSVLSSCVHEGLVDLGLEYFNLMPYYNIEPTVKHYTCMVDLLCRACRLNEAYELVKKMEVDADIVTWSVLLSGCVMHRNVQLGEIAAKKVIDLDPHSTGNYVMLANLYASVGRWDDLARTRQAIKNQEMNKIPGCSWIEDREQVHVFVASDRSHKQAEKSMQLSII
ncbi:hypothetical protein GIB67_033349 [Kingdonia uniflora]|uniref:Pentatricopeptide repeat-containing protein n=1 Tax=Kingdonia uniflora TaxID=39325 RepID=A0A7J7LTZ5_9MAGN|nr:hypothetical protein GIB67_033349 [Kingdonia uniflora]